MPIYMIQHITNDKIAIDLAVAFYLKIKNKLYKKCISCWVDYKKNSVFYLIKTINKNSIKKLYYKSFNLAPHKITHVNSNLVHAYLKNEQKTRKTQLKSLQKKQKTFFIIINSLNNTLLKHNIGKIKAKKLQQYRNEVIHHFVNAYGGNIIESINEGIVAIFSSSQKAFNCASSIQKKIKKKTNKTNCKTTLYIGSFHEKKRFLSQKIPQIISSLYFINNKNHLIISSSILKSDSNNNTHQLQIKQEEFLFSLMNILTNNFDNSEFNINDFCDRMMMSKTKLYRNCKSLTGKSINELLRKYRLYNSLELLTKANTSISQVSIDMGFNSCSYFSNCFKKEFGVSPRDLSYNNDTSSVIS